jgi:4-hydroxybenzoate polyprenyltransferase
VKIIVTQLLALSNPTTTHPMNGNEIPLCIDLDGTLIHTDMLHESAVSALRNSPWTLFMALLSFLIGKGKAHLKKQLAQKIIFEPSTLPYHQNFLEWLKVKQSEGRRLILCTATDATIANRISDHLKLFDEVMASDGKTNLSKGNKAKALLERYGNKGYDYAGNSTDDLPVWAGARKSIVVSNSNSLASTVRKSTEIDQIFGSPAVTWRILFKTFRLHQWLKNSLIFIPMIAAHQIHVWTNWITLGLAFLAFSLCASSVYIANDLLDLNSDRKHPRKRFRPFASGQLSIYWGFILFPALLFSSLAIGLHINSAFAAWLVIYFLITTIYSFRLKQLPLIDCLTLAGLYTLRIVAGAAALQLGLSFWLLAFSCFIFLSLAFLKRYAELRDQLSIGHIKAHGRGYYSDDANLIQTLGVSSGLLAVLVLAFYLNSAEVLRLYIQPTWIWGCLPIMLYWVSWMWLKAHRGEMHDDPLVFAVKDPSSIFAGLVFILFLLLGSTSFFLAFDLIIK